MPKGSLKFFLVALGAYFCIPVAAFVVSISAQKVNIHSWYLVVAQLLAIVAISAWTSARYQTHRTALGTGFGFALFLANIMILYVGWVASNPQRELPASEFLKYLFLQPFSLLDVWYLLLPVLFPALAYLVGVVIGTKVLGDRKPAANTSAG